MHIVILVILLSLVLGKPLSDVVPTATDSGTWDYRHLVVGTWTFGLWSGGWWSSVQADGSTKQPIANGDFMWGSVYAGTGNFPYSWLSYYDASIQTNRNISNPGGINWATFNVSVSSGYIASSFLALTEKNGTEVVNQLLLKDMIWTYNATQSANLTNTTAGVYAYVFDGNRLIAGWPSIQIQYILTTTPTTLATLNTPVFPKALESIVIIEDWQYEDPSNKLVLQVAIGSAEGSWTSDGQIQAGSGNSQVFFYLSNQVQVDGAIKPAQIGLKVNASLQETFNNGPVVAQLISRYQGQASCQIVEVIFPAGASRIVYDPSMGSGESPYAPNPDTTNNLTIIIVICVVGGIILILVLIGIAFACRRRADYTTVKE